MYNQNLIIILKALFHFFISFHPIYTYKKSNQNSKIKFVKFFSIENSIKNSYNVRGVVHPHLNPKPSPVIHRYGSTTAHSPLYYPGYMGMTFHYYIIPQHNNPIPIYSIY